MFGYRVGLGSRPTVTDTLASLEMLWGEQRFDFSTAFVLSYHLHKQLQIEARYVQGINTLHTIAFVDELLNPLADAKLRNRSLQLSLLYRFKQG